MDRVVVDPENKYSVSIYNLPKPDLGNYRLDKIFTIPGEADMEFDWKSDSVKLLNVY